MEYLIYGLGAIFVIYKVAVYFGRKNAIDVLCHNYQISKEKVGELSGQQRTLYSLRHTYATMELLAGTDIHTVPRQMGTSVLMLERH